MIFMNTNLDWLTCIHNFEVPLQLENKSWFKYYSKKDLNSKLNFKPCYTIYYTVEAL
jgi:hypothetical protein